MYKIPAIFQVDYFIYQLDRDLPPYFALYQNYLIYLLLI